MDEQEWMRRVDRHLDSIERGNETLKNYMREGHELMARIDERLEHLDETLDRNAQAFLGMRSYLDGATRVLGQMVADMRADRALQRDWREESRAYRDALLAKVDRLRGEPPPATA